jgi:uncharacterized membrane protein
MLIIPTGHYQEISRPRKIGSREKWIIGSSIGLLAVIAVAVVIAFTSVQRSSRNGCIDVSAATVIGGSELYRCGSAARALCTAPGSQRTSKNISFARALADSCRKAGLPVPPVPDGS